MWNIWWTTGGSNDKTIPRKKPEYGKRESICAGFQICNPL
jgi:hypothetical protein